MTNTNEILVKYAVWLNEARQHLDEALEQYNLTRPEWLILGLLRINPEGISQAYAKRYLAVETSYFSKILNKLEDKSFIERIIDKTDRRNRLLTINPKPPKTLNKVFKIIEDFNTALEKDLSQQEVKVLSACIAKLESKLLTIRSQK